MPDVFEFGRQPDLFARDLRIFDALAHLGFVFVGKSGVDMTIALLQRKFDRLGYFFRFALPRSKTKGGDLRACVERESLTIGNVSTYFSREIIPDRSGR